MVRMLTLRYALLLFVCYFVMFTLYYRFYFRPRLYLMLLAERSYLDHYIDQMPHMRERPDERRDMAEFLLAKRRTFLRSLGRFVCGVTVAYLVLLYLGATA
jgi:hypothetical protein